MAKKTNKETAESKAKITRIKAADTEQKPAKQKTEKPSASATVPAKKPRTKSTKKRRNPFGPLGRYFKGAWQELNLVRWPNRRATWGMTAAVLAYTALFVGLIVLLDLAFSKLLEIIIG